MPITYVEAYYNYKVDGDFVTWLEMKSNPPDNLELVSILPAGSPFMGGARGGNPDGDISMRCACYFRKVGP